MSEPTDLLQYFCGYLVILRHLSAQFRQACAHNLQCSICRRFSHSSAHASQISAQILQICFAYSLSLDINWEEVQQTVAQSRPSWIHLSSTLISSSRRYEVAQNSQDSAQALHASMQSWYFWFWRNCLLIIILSSQYI